jgi:hypothetical protein
MSPNMRKRSRPDDWLIHFGEIYRKGVNVTNGLGRLVTWTGQQITVDQEHGRAKDGKFHVGGPFFSVHIRPEIRSRTSRIPETAGGSNKFIYYGPICIPVPESFGGFKLPSEDSSYLDPIGAEAIAIVDPSNPNAETGVALAELTRDRIPIPGIQSWKRRTEIAKAAGSEYLNAVFGWLPLVSDIKDTVQSIRDGNTIMKNYQDASGNNVHREFEFDPIEKESLSTFDGRASYGDQVFVPYLSNSPTVKINVHRKETIKRWFSGTFTYHANAEQDSFAKALGYGSEADKLFGFALTPDIVWELTPWSWAIDWFTNTQQVLSNIGAFELAGLVMRYGYIMEETTIVDTYSMPSAALLGDTGTVPDSTVTYTVKRRREANPFGFGLKWEGLSPTQLAITAALGITRLL